MPQSADALRIYRFVERAKKITHKFFLSDGVRTYTARMNPQSFDNTSEAVQIDVQTLAGPAMYDFGVKANVISMQGFTGIDGLDGPGGLYALEHFRPMVGRPNKLIMFGYPARFSGVRYCYLRKLTDSNSIAKHLYWSYDIQLVELGPHMLTPIAQVPAPSYPFQAS